MRNKHAGLAVAILFAQTLIVEMAFGQNQPQPPKDPPPIQKESAPSQSERRRPTTAPAPFKPAEEVSPSRKLSYPNDI